MGSGLSYAERKVKELKSTDNEQGKLLNKKINLEGMECRWDKIKPAKSKDKVLCLLVNCNDNSLQASVYARVLKKIENVFGNLEQRKPIEVSELRLEATFKKLKMKCMLN